MCYRERYDIARQIVAKAANPSIVLAPVQWVKDADEMFAFHSVYIKEGWEGSMLRQLGLGYAVNHRDVSLMKLKDFKEEEFEIVDVVNAGDAKFEGCAKFIMVLNDGSGKTFECIPEGPIPYKRQLLAEREEHIGKRWTVRWPLDENGGLSEDGKPKYAVGVAERPDAV
jgi:ATP-dependent DNA ligase